MATSEVPGVGLATRPAGGVRVGHEGAEEVQKGREVVEVVGKMGGGHLSFFKPVTEENGVVFVVNVVGISCCQLDNSISLLPITSQTTTPPTIKQLALTGFLVSDLPLLFLVLWFSTRFLTPPFFHSFFFHLDADSKAKGALCSMWPFVQRRLSPQNPLEAALLLLSELWLSV